MDAKVAVGGCASVFGQCGSRIERPRIDGEAHVAVDGVDGRVVALDDVDLFVVVIAAGQQGFDSALQVTGWLQPRAAVGLAVFRLLLRAHPQYVNLFGGAGYEGHVLVFIHAEVDKRLVL